ncbi:cardiolipin synthase [Thermomonas brevis]|uniref:Cardiolipin synthase n=1 Tax=Thermomonas brevis TaxID=215691 RepID=A0A7G9QPJ7_9GAMM|nr:cardiolipin synthase [Thermomonas brevis]QNN45272.1 cardiolipin synthase [Thermomonas brevis]
MLEGLWQAWNAFWAIPHIRAWLTAGWALYLLWLGGWIVLQKREPAATLSWLVSLAALPYIGFAVYYVFGPQRIVRHRARRRRHHAHLPRDPEGPGDESIELRTLAHATTGLAPSTARDVRLLIDGGHKYPALLEAIAQARDHVHLEYYIYNPDRTGGALLDALVERARAGVKVRLLVDAMGSKLAKRRFFAPLVEAGGELAWFHPARPWTLWKRPWMNLRTHRKIVVIDGRVGFLGGINITDEEDERLREDAYRDLHLRVEGDIVRSLQEVFVEDWAYATQRTDFVGDVVRAMPPAQTGPMRAQLLTSGPDSPWEAIHRMYVGAIHAATRRVWLTTPYFVPGEAAMMALTSAALGGLDVRLLVPRMSDSKLVTYCVRSYYDDLLAAGVKVYEYGPRMLHTKALLVDDALAVIGSANFDHRSFRLNFEASLLFEDAAVAGELAQLIEREFASAPRVRADRPRPLLSVRLPEALARLMAPLL